MKTKVSTILVMLLITVASNAQFLDYDKTQVSIWSDLVASEKEDGLHIGIDLQKIMHWGWAGISVSNFEVLKDGYTDIVGSGGVNFNLFNYTKIRYYAGARVGVLFRGSDGYPLIGAVIGADYRIAPNMHVGIRLWPDYRGDQTDQFYGDSDAYQKGWVTNNPMIQENGALVVSFSF